MHLDPIAPAAALLALVGQTAASPITASPDVGSPTSDVYPPAGSKQ